MTSYQHPHFKLNDIFLFFSAHIMVANRLHTILSFLNKFQKFCHVTDFDRLRHTGSRDQLLKKIICLKCVRGKFVHIPLTDLQRYGLVASNLALYTILYIHIKRNMWSTTVHRNYWDKCETVLFRLATSNVKLFLDTIWSGWR